MHPAYSVIFFTTSSGAGYGLLFWLALAYLLPGTGNGGWFWVVSLTLALVLVTLGLLSSLLHLGHPERAHRSISQWRSSWLSREGAAALATYLPAGLLWLAWLMGLDGALTYILALLSVVGAVVTVWCTGMIYASLRTIRQWHRPDVAPLYLALSAATGALLLSLMASLFGLGRLSLLALVALAALAVAAWMKLSYWRGIDGDAGRYTREQALGLPGLRSATPLDPPHTQPNFVMREMGYAVGRKHARRLRRIAAAALFAVPALTVLLALIWPPAAPVLLLAGTVSAALGVGAERWLFFAEAEHVSMLYYTAARA